MTATRIINSIMFEKWQFDTLEEAKSAVEKEAIVCGDEIQLGDNSGYMIYNHHSDSVRWVGIIGEKK